MCMYACPRARTHSHTHTRMRMHMDMQAPTFCTRANEPSPNRLSTQLFLERCNFGSKRSVSAFSEHQQSWRARVINTWSDESCRCSLKSFPFPLCTTPTQCLSALANDKVAITEEVQRSRKRKGVQVELTLTWLHPGSRQEGILPETCPQFPRSCRSRSQYPSPPRQLAPVDIWAAKDRINTSARLIHSFSETVTAFTKWAVSM